MRKQHKYLSGNSICRDAGHDWMTTAAANWRVCQREKCRASERLVNGQWLSNTKLYRQHDPVVASRTNQRRPRQSVSYVGARSSTMNEQIKVLRLHLWEVTNEAMFLSWDQTPLNQQHVAYLGEQLGSLTRFLARLHIYPIDDIRVASPSQKEV